MKQKGTNQFLVLISLGVNAFWSKSQEEAWNTILHFYWQGFKICLGVPFSINTLSAISMTVIFSSSSNQWRRGYFALKCPFQKKAKPSQSKMLLWEVNTESYYYYCYYPTIRWSCMHVHDLPLTLSLLILFQMFLVKISASVLINTLVQ